MQPTLVLASSSPYRRALLERLRLPFTAAAPQVDEHPLAGETPDNLVRRLAELKARALASRFPQAVIIGSDQVAVLNGQILGKPQDFPRALAQLTAMRSQTVRFLTGLCVYAPASGSVAVDCIAYDVVMRDYTDAEVRAYLAREQPYDCAGSFKSEGLGVTLFERQCGDDPTALIGLPLIGLCALLRRHGLDPLAGAF